MREKVAKGRSDGGARRVVDVAPALANAFVRRG